MDAFIGEIQILPYTFAPLNWAYCDGQLLPISQYTQLFAVIQNAFGGDGRNTLGLPNLKGRVPMHQGSGPYGSHYQVGQQSGEANVTLTTDQLPTHTHAVQADATKADQAAPAGEVLAEGHVPSRGGGKDEYLYTTSAPNANMGASAVAMAGGGQPHNNMQPYLALNFCIALEGIFPSRN